MNKKQFIQYYYRFSRWQQETRHYVNRHQGSVQHCHNCGTEFSDNFCPRCGQKAELGRVGWQSIKDNITLLWGLDSRSLTYSLVQLMLRPGYLVRDYISGHRQVSFPPVKMLVLVSLFMVVFESVFHLENDVIGLYFKNKELIEVIKWMNAQKSWTTLLVQSILILPTWLVFRYAPGYPRHSLPEGFFLQVFLSSQALILSFFGYWSGATEIALCMVFMYITYRQLFGYGWWGTLWRFTVVTLMLGAVIVIALTIMLLFFGNEEESRFDTDAVEGYLYIIVAIVAFMAVLLGVTHLINKHTFRKNNNETIKVNSQTL